MREQSQEEANTFGMLGYFEHPENIETGSLVASRPYRSWHGEICSLLGNLNLLWSEAPWKTPLGVMFNCSLVSQSGQLVYHVYE